MSETEIPLAGGNVNLGVVRVGDTVRRAMTPASSAVHALLRHLEYESFSGCPKFLGIDAKRREILNYVEGDTGVSPDLWETDAPLVATAKLLRAYHDATIGFQPPEPATWAFSYPDGNRHEVICHNDFAPYNFVFTDGVPTAILDFDLAEPGPRLRDVAYAAYWLVPLSFHSADMVPFAEADLRAGSARLKRFCQVYGIEADGALLDMVAEVLAHMGDAQAAVAMIGEAAADRLRAGGHLEHWQREAKAFMAQRAALEANLFRGEAGSE